MGTKHRARVRFSLPAQSSKILIEPTVSPQLYFIISIYAIICIIRIHSDNKIEEIKRLRRNGFGINHIVSLSAVPKTTVWHHVHDVRLSNTQKAVLRSNQGGSRKRKLDNIKKAEERASLLLNNRGREFIAMIAMLYWAEGHKKGRCEFTNTDGRMIAFYLKILRYKLDISEQQIKVAIRIFTGMKEKECLNYWSSVVNIPARNIKVRMNDGGSSGRTKYGMCRITIIKGHGMLKLMHALIDKVSKDVLGY